MTQTAYIRLDQQRDADCRVSQLYFLVVLETEEVAFQELFDPLFLKGWQADETLQNNNSVLY